MESAGARSSVLPTVPAVQVFRREALDEGEEKGYELKKIQFGPYAVWIVYERPTHQ